MDAIVRAWVAVSAFPKKVSVKQNVTGINRESQEYNVSGTSNQLNMATALCPEGSQLSLSTFATRKVDHVLLSTAVILIRDQNGEFHKCRALLDCGSQSNFITSKLKAKLNVNSADLPTTIMGVGHTSLNILKQIHTTIRSRVNTFEITIPFLVIDQITDPIPRFKIATENLNIPKGVTLADSSYHIPSDIDILLGASVFWQLLGSKQIPLSRGGPILQETNLGWVIAGPIVANVINHSSKKSYCGLSTDKLIHQQLERFWFIEEVGHSSMQSDEERLCEEHFTATHQRDSEGRYLVTLPLKENISKLGESYNVAERRFLALERKLERQPDLKQQYHDFMQEYISLNHMTEISPSDKEIKQTYHIPHHCVIKEDSLTTKLRVVFDASCPTSSGLALNNCMMVGPTIQRDLFSLIVRLRQHKYAMSADIAKMYRQVNVVEEHRNLQRILWRWSRNEPLRIYKLNTVTYGMASSPFLAIRCLKELASQYAFSFPEASKVIAEDFYVDDLLTGGDNLDVLFQLKDDVIRILSSAKFDLRKWKSNSSDLCGISDNPSLSLAMGEPSKTLGIWWNPRADTFHYHMNLNDKQTKITKRAILSRVAQIYDPLGWLGPVIINAKIILQRLWQGKVNWDEDVPPEIGISWSQFEERIKFIDEIIIPRRIVCDNPKLVELHGFCDSSQVAYGACVYLRTIDASNNYHVNLICAKSRVAPLKQISLPRLELCGALLLANLCNKITEALSLSVQSIYYWSDSTIALSWISGESSQWTTFVANRVAEIQKLTEKTQWFHIRSEINPADMLSRGISADRLRDMSLWWHGPPFLLKDSAIQSFNPRTSSIEIPEGRSIKPIVCTAAHTSCDVITRFSSLARLRRVITYCLRLCRRSTMSTSSLDSRTLTVEELQKAMTAIVRLCQTQAFGKEQQTLKTSGKVDSKSKLFNLQPFLDSNRIIRVGGRLKNAPLTYSQKYPMVLPTKHHLTKLIIRDAHYKNLHAGPQAILCTIRQEYWPLSGRQAVRWALKGCLICFRFRPVTAEFLMGNLPSARVTPSRAFTTTGLDYAGPFKIKVSRNKTDKSYLAIFICLATKAVHFELVSDLTSNTFLNALKRFLARRGLCHTLYSDNGTTFVGANNQLKELQTFLTDGVTQTQIHTYLSERSIEWKFIPPYSPHMGGLWEAAVKSAKTHLNKVVGTTPLSFEELYTIFTQVEACLNSRPLVPMSNDPSDMSVLTPGHFLIGNALNSIPEEELTEVPSNRLNRYQLISQMTQTVWKRWAREYITQLQHRSKWNKNPDQRIQPGMMVILKNENTPSMTWPLGRVIDAHPGTDGITRVITIRTANGTTKRSLAKVCILPIDDN